MGFYPDVKPGDQFKPSARLSNEVRHFFNGVQSISAGKSIKSAFANNNRVAVINSGKTVLPAYTAIYVYDRNTETNNKTGFVELNLLAKTATSDQLLWGVTENDIEPNGIGMMVISGIAQAFITGSGNYATPGANGKLVAGTSGKALILHPGDAETPGIVQLGYSGGAIDDYTGPFKIIRENETTIAVVNGSAPNFEYCGNTDLPGAENVAKKTFAFEGKEIRIYLHACHNNGVYSTVLAKRGETVAGSFDSRLIGIVYSNGTIQQTRFDSYQIIYRNDYYL